MPAHKNAHTMINEFTKRNKKFPADAYFFVLSALDFTTKKSGVLKHISGQQLLEGIREYALQEYGPMTRSVLNHWNIYETAHFGCIVFDLVSLGVIKKTDEDSIEDFSHGYDFSEVFP